MEKKKHTHTQQPYNQRNFFNKRNRLLPLHWYCVSSSFLWKIVIANGKNEIERERKKNVLRSHFRARNDDLTGPYVHIEYVTDLESAGKFSKKKNKKQNFLWNQLCGTRFSCEFHFCLFLCGTDRKWKWNRRNSNFPRSIRKYEEKKKQNTRTNVHHEVVHKCSIKTIQKENKNQTECANTTMPNKILRAPFVCIFRIVICFHFSLVLIDSYVLLLLNNPTRRKKEWKKEKSNKTKFVC